jgi:hydrogenase maturation factor
METGKLPNELLAQLLAKVQPRDPRVVLGPGIGRDAAVIDNGGPKLLVAKTDPITFAAELIGWYAVHINANDIACMGARPAWLMTSVLLPQGAAPALAETIFGQVLDACRELDIELVGGHTEITYRLDRPIVVAALLGEVEREALVTPEGARPGDALILTKGIAIEGTAVLGREAGETLAALGLSPDEIESAKRCLFDPGISVIREAAAACKAVRVHAMHDPTEGGLATALYEMAAAARCGIQLDPRRIRVLPMTQRLCEAAGLDPMGLLASGSLLLAVAPEDADTAVAAIRSAGIEAAMVGGILPPGRGVIMNDDIGRPVPRFARDEVARFFSERGD